MPLDKPTLTADIIAVFAADPAPSRRESADRLAAAYHKYASSGSFNGGLPVLLDAHRDALADALYEILDPETGLAASFVAAWVTGLTTYWSTVPVAGATIGNSDGIANPGLVTAPALAVIALPMIATPQTAGAALAAGLIAATDTVTATVKPPDPPAPVPIT
jgi:hypothetical protein